MSDPFGFGEAGLYREAPPTSERVAAIARAIFDDAQDTFAAGDVAREELPGGCGLLHKGQSALFFGDREGGKSTVVLTLGASVAASGGRVLYLDRENGAALTKAKLRGILDAHPDWPPVDEAEMFVGRHYPSLSADWAPEDFAAAIMLRGPFALVVFDSFREFLTERGADPNSDRDVSAFVSGVVTPLLVRGVAVALADNVGHEDKRRPKNSGTKGDAIPQGYLVTTPVKFSPTQIGKVRVECTRSRFGDTERDWTMRVGGGLFDLPQTTSEAPDAKQAREAAAWREQVRVAAIAVLRELHAAGKRLPGRDPLTALVCQEPPKNDGRSPSKSVGLMAAVSRCGRPRS